MEIISKCSRASLLWIIFFMSLFCLAVNGGFLYALNLTASEILPLADAAGNSTQAFDLVQKAAQITDLLRQYFIPASAGVFAVFSLFLWLFQRISIKRVITRSLPDPAEAKPKTDSKSHKMTAVEKAEIERTNRLYFMHLLSALQREGRLMDFFAEDLEEYEDEQIGAAVRSIHENCNKTLAKYVTFEPVLDQEEEDELTVEPGFDPAALRLTGNVAGEPPFKGIVRHTGWRAKRLDLPILSGNRNPQIIAPAEVEI